MCRVQYYEDATGLDLASVREDLLEEHRPERRFAPAAAVQICVAEFTSRVRRARVSCLLFSGQAPVRAMLAGPAEAPSALVGDGYEQTGDGEADEEALPLDPHGKYLLLDCEALVSAAGESAPAAKRASLSMNPSPGPSPPSSALLSGTGVASARLGDFVLQMQELCKAALDARSGGSATRSGAKSAKIPSRREAASAASVVEELEGIEAKARAGKYDGRVEDVISEVSRCIENQSATFSDVLPAIEEKADELRVLVDESERRLKVFDALRAASLGVVATARSSEEKGATRSPRSLSIDAPAGCDGDPVGARVAAIHVQATRRFGELAADAAAADTLDGVEEAWSKRFDGDDDDALALSASTMCEFVTLSASSALPRREVGRSTTTPATSTNDDTSNPLAHPVMSTFEAIGRIRDLRKQIFAFFDQVTSGREPSNGTPVRPVPPNRVEGDRPTIGGGAATIGSSGTESGAQVSRTKERSEASAVELVIRNEPSRVAMEMETNTGIVDDELQSGPEVWRKARAATALLLAHGGVAEASDNAINVLAELTGEYIQRIGRNLSSSRARRGLGVEDVVKRKTRRMTEQAAGVGVADTVITNDMSADANNVDSELGFVAPQAACQTREDTFELIKIICSTGFRGGFPELQQYTGADIPRLSLEVREAEAKVRSKMTEFAALHSSHLPNTSDAEPSVKPAPPSASCSEDVAKAQPPEDVEMAQSSQDDAAPKSSPTPDVESAARLEKEAPITASDSEIEAGVSASSLLPLNDAARMFGILTPSVRLDVLLGVDVPRKLVALAAPQQTPSLLADTITGPDVDGDVSMAT